MGINVLIVDDSSVMRKIIARSVRQVARDPIDNLFEAADGAEAIERLNAASVDVIFSDIYMPHMGGLEMLRELHDTPYATTPVILVTTEGGEKTVLEALQLGAKGFIKKPFTASQIDMALTKALRG